MAIEIKAQKATAPASKPVRAAAPLWSRLNVNIDLGSGGPGLKERLLFVERLELLLETGVSLLEALKVMQLQTEEPRLAGIIGSMIDTVAEGKPFSLALARHPKMFPTTYVSLVAAAEEGGFLPQVLQQLRLMDEKNTRMRAAVVSALSYPAFLVAFSFAVVVFVLVVIFPKFHDLFLSIHDQLPRQTIILMFLSDFLREHWLPTLLLCGGGLGALVYGLKTPRGVLLRDQLKMHTPVLKHIFIQTYLNQSLTVIGMSLANGVPITVALGVAQDVVANSIFARFLKTLLSNVQQGRGLAVGFSETAFIPPMVRQMISTGEQTGNVAKVMQRVADFYARELDRRIAAFAKMAEPVMLMVMGAVVGLIVSALILPIFKLSRAVH